MSFLPLQGGALHGTGARISAGFFCFFDDIAKMTVWKMVASAQLFRRGYRTASNSNPTASTHEAQVAASRRLQEIFGIHLNLPRATMSSLSALCMEKDGAWSLRV